MEKLTMRSGSDCRKQTGLQAKAIILFVLLCILLSSGRPGDRAEGATGIPQGDTIVRVALGIGQSGVTLSVSRGSFTAVDPDRGTEVGAAVAGQKYSISPAGGGVNVSRDGAVLSSGTSRILLKPGDEATDILMYGAAGYRGSFLVENKNGVLNVINVLDVDHYLLGVLPLEMGLSTAPPEALKAQAVVSRTYALHKKSDTGSYDLVAGQYDQMYGGYTSEKAHTTAAVEATRGQALYYDGRLIEAFFSSNSGGYTEDAENVWNEALPYAKAVASPYDAYALEAAQDSAGYPGNTYRWQVRYTIAELQDKITEWNRNNPDSRVNIGSLRSLSAYALAYDPTTRRITDLPNTSGRITRLDLTGTGGTHSLYRDSIRALLGLRSAMFTVTPEGGIAVRNEAGATEMLGMGIREASGLVADGKASEINPGSGSFFVATAEGIVEMNKDSTGTVTAFVLDGQGYGHGVGMSQWGAIGMAAAGMTYGQILEHYYNRDINDGRLVVRMAG